MRVECGRWGRGFCSARARAHCHLGHPNLSTAHHRNRITGSPVDIPNHLWPWAAASHHLRAGGSQHRMPTPSPSWLCQYQESRRRAARRCGARDESLPKPFPPHAGPSASPSSSPSTGGSGG